MSLTAEKVIADQIQYQLNVQLLCFSGQRLVFSVVNDIFGLSFCQKIIATVSCLLVKLASGQYFTKIVSNIDNMSYLDWTLDFAARNKGPRF